MKIPLAYGLYLALGGALLTLLLYFAGLHDSVEKLKLGQWIGSIGGIALTVTFLALAMRAKRSQRDPEANWTYGSALGVGILTGLAGTLLGGLFTYIYFAFLNPDMSELILETQLAAMEQKGMTAAQLERSEPMMRKWMSPGVMSVLQTFMGFLWSTVLAAIIAIFFRKPAPGAAPDDVPAAA